MTGSRAADYCSLNRVTALDSYPISQIADLTAVMRGEIVFSSTDLVCEADILKTAATSFHLFEFWRFRFELTSGKLFSVCSTLFAGQLLHFRL